MMSHPEFSKQSQSDIIFTKNAPRNTKDTKLDVDDVSLRVLCVLFFSSVIIKCRFCSVFEKIRDDSCLWFFVFSL